MSNIEVSISQKHGAHIHHEIFEDNNYQKTIAEVALHTDSSSINEKYATLHVIQYSEGVNDDKCHNIMGFGGQRLHHSISGMPGAEFLLSGYDKGVKRSLLTLPAFYEQFPSMVTHAPELKSKNATWQGFVVAIYEIGCLEGSLATIYVDDKIARRKTIVLGGTVMIIGAVILAALFSAGQLLVARIIRGIGNEFNTSTVPVWQTECAKPERRGPLVMSASAIITGGVMILYWIDFGFFFVKNSLTS